MSQNFCYEHGLATFSRIGTKINKLQKKKQLYIERNRDTPIEQSPYNSAFTKILLTKKSLRRPLSYNQITDSARVKSPSKPFS